MIKPDLINAMFMFTGSLLLWLNVVVLIKSKKYEGVSIIPHMFFMMWGFWNTYWFDYLQQPLSWYGSIAMLIPNLVWSIIALYYKFVSKKSNIITQ